MPASVVVFLAVCAVCAWAFVYFALKLLADLFPLDDRGCGCSTRDRPRDHSD